MSLEIVNSGNNYFTFDRIEGVLRPVLREEVEGWRGIKRTKDGSITRTDEWKESRIKFLKDKIKDYSIRISSCKDEIFQLETELNLEKSNIDTPIIIEKIREIVKIKEVPKEIYIPKNIYKEILVEGKPLIHETVKEIYIYINFWDKMKLFTRDILQRIAKLWQM